MKSLARSTVNESRAREESDVRVQMQHRWRRRKLVTTEPEEISSGVLEQTCRRILVLQLKRFQVSSAFTLLKQHNRVHIDTELQLTLPVQRIPEDHIHKEPKPPDPLGRLAPPDEDRKADERQAERNELGEPVSRYRLVSVLNHVGRRVHAGHYVSDCSSQSNSCWLSYDDESVTMKTEERVMKQRQRSAYVLFYEMK
ncbi:hypothetical protein MHYP_G00116320 [Metynnis hypsauchen]